MSFVTPADAAATSRATCAPMLPKTIDMDDVDTMTPVNLTPAEAGAFGYALYEKLGRPRRLVAPMVNQSELPFRLLCAKDGAADLVYTPMLHSRSFGESLAYREKIFSTCDGEAPLIVQFCSNDPLLLLRASRFVEGRCAAVDINLGCPQGIARRGNYGSFLLDTQGDLIVRMVTCLKRNLKIPVTCKIRVLPDIDATIALALRLQVGVVASEEVLCSTDTLSRRCSSALACFSRATVFCFVILFFYLGGGMRHANGAWSHERDEQTPRRRRRLRCRAQD
jgi:tRNA-dihydrouridine synthase 1